MVYDPFAGKAPSTAEARNRATGKPLTKGTAILGTVRYIKENHPSAWPRILDAVTPETARLLRDNVFPSTWYPVQAFVDLAHTMCAVLDGGAEDVAIRWGADVIRRDMSGGVYRAFLKIAAPQWLLKSTSAVWGLYHGSGRSVILAEGPQFAHVLTYGFWCPSNIIWRANLGADEEALRLCGARGVRSTIVAGGGRDDRYLEFQIRWER